MGLWRAYDPRVFEMTRTLKPSGRGEMCYSVLEGYWSDAGTFESLFRASELASDMDQNNGN